jgi:hypothetical protein
MLDKLDGRAPQQDGVQPLPPVSEITPGPTSNVPAAAAAATEKQEGDNDSDAENGGNTSGSSALGGSMSNTIGQLQELCVHKGLPMPIYDLGAVEGQPHMRQFAMTVRVGQLSAKGEGTSKKDAKRDAACKMVNSINGMIIEKTAEGGEGTTGAAGEELSKADEELGKVVAEMKIDPLTKKHSVKIQQFYRNMQVSHEITK